MVNYIENLFDDFFLKTGNVPIVVKMTQAVLDDLNKELEVAVRFGDLFRGLEIVKLYGTDRIVFVEGE